MNKKLAKLGAKWWADKLRTPAMLDNGDNSETGFMTLGIALMLQQSERSGINSEKIDAFERELTSLLLLHEGEWLSIRVDYGPDRILRSALDVAGITGMTVLPWKTHMNIHNGKITVSEGYGGNPVDLC